jgi:hypothetical protein
MSRSIPSDVHPSPTTWLTLALGALEPSAAKDLERHVRTCASCRASSEGARVLARAAQPGVFEPVPRTARRRAEAAFIRGRRRESRAAGTGITSVLGRLRVLLPTRRFGDASAASFAIGMRGAETEFRCTLEGGAHRIDLEWMPRGTAWNLRGRVVSERREEFPRLLLELAAGGSRRVAPGPRGFFGPIRLVRPEFRLRLETAVRSFRSPWVPSAPRATPARKSRG